MIDNNTRAINKLISQTLFYSAIFLIALLLLIPLGIFNFSHKIVDIIVFAGIPATMFPIILYKLKVPDNFLKYYMFISLGLLIGLLGSQSGIGIYITYVLVPIASCLYISRRFTVYISTICYFVMVAAVYFNTSNKMEVTLKGWSHKLTFRNYIIGFTFEYIVVIIFILILVSRAQQFLRIQENNLRLQKIENDKQKRITDFYINALSGQRTTVFNAVSEEMDKFTPEDFVKMSAGHRFTSSIQDILKVTDDDSVAMHNALASIGEYFGLARILYINSDSDSHDKNHLSYSWSRREKYALQNFYSKFDNDDFALISSEYDKYGYIQLIPGESESQQKIKKIECGLTRYMEAIAIGTQLWIPTLEDGRYSGAICFEKSENVLFTPVDILILSDIVTSLSMYVASTTATRANKAKSAFLSTMSHEIRTPMNAILGMTTVALREDMNDTVRNSLNIIKSSSEGLLGIINDILDFSKIESGKFEIIPENYEVSRLVEDVKVIAQERSDEKNLELSFNVSENLPHVLNGDVVRIKQIMVNLVSNAIKYTDEGSIKMDLSCSECNTSSIMMKFSVADTGQGIRKEDKDKLFDSFTQVNQKTNHHKEGTGLGLAISNQLASLMNGYIGFESQYGVGSTFYFEIPQTVVSSTSSDNEISSERAPSNNVIDEESVFTAPGAKILIVDDNEINRMVAESMLEIFEMDIDMADGGIHALEMTKAQKYDIIFMDNFMPDLDGISTTKAIRNDPNNPNCNTVIIALTADAMSDSRDKMIQCGMNDFLSKPIDLKHCTNILKKHLG